MVLVTVPGNTYAVGIAKSVPLADYWIDKYEVTNAEFKQFVDAGGYRDQKYWTGPFHDGAACSPSTTPSLDSETPPAGLAQHRGSSAAFPMGRQTSLWAASAGSRPLLTRILPASVCRRFYHWYRASNPEDLFSDILRFGNFDSQGPVRSASGRVTVRGARSTWRETSRSGARTSPMQTACDTSPAEAGTSRPIDTPSPTRETPGNGRRRRHAPH